MESPLSVPARTNSLSLPPELSTEVWSILALADLKRLRFVGRALDKVTSSAVFHTFILYPHGESVTRLQELTNSSHLAHQVCEIVYDDLYRDAIRAALDRHDSPFVAMVISRSTSIG